MTAVTQGGMLPKAAAFGVQGASVTGQIGINSIVGISSDQVSCDLAGETAILNVKSGIYYGLDEVGVRVWELIQEPRAVSSVRDALLQEYDVEAALCESDLLVLLKQLNEAGLVELRG